jgi:uncharacterized protein YceK
MSNMNVRNIRAVATVVSVVAVVVALVSGCGAVSWIMNDGVSNPITPEQSKAQVMDAAKELVGILDLPVSKAVFWHSSCNDQGDAPFRGVVSINYPLAPSFEEADANVAQMVKRLQSQGWTGDPDFHTHGTVLTKNGVQAVFAPQNAATPNNGIDLYGECRDATTTKDTKGTTEDVILSRP